MHEQEDRRPHSQDTPAFRINELGERGLYQGHIHYELPGDSLTSFRATTQGRNICDAALLFTLGDSGAVTLSLTHYIPQQRKHHAAVIHQEASFHPSGKRIAVLLSDLAEIDDVSENTEYSQLITELAQFNQGKTPHTIAVDNNLIHADTTDFQLVYERRHLRSTHHHVVSVPATPFLLHFLSGDKEKVAALPPQKIIKRAP